MNKEEIKLAMDELTPSYFEVKGGAFADYIVGLEGGKLYAQAIARILHANEEHAVKNTSYNIIIKDVAVIEQVIEKLKKPLLVVTVRVESPIYGVRENVMTAILDTSETNNPIAAMHPVEMAVTQAIGRCLSTMGFAFTGTLASIDEVNECERRQQVAQEIKADPLTQLKSAAQDKGIDWNKLLEDNSVTEAQLEASRGLCYRILQSLK